jgi:DNA-binding CsgD family transcriptional regulator
MNSVAEEIKAVMENGELMHIGMPRRSGRYPWGSGDDPYQHGRDFLGRVDELRAQGFTYTDESGKKWTGDTAIAKSLGLSTTQFRTELSLAKNERRMLDVARAKSLKKDGLGPTEIGAKMGLPESTVRSLLNEGSENRMKQAQETADFIRKRIEEKGMVDVGKGVERELGISKEKLNQALYILEREGYPVYSGRMQQNTNLGQFTTQKVICPKGTQHKEIYNFDEVHTVKDYISRDGGETYEKKFTYPESMDSKRLKIRYNEEGGLEKDGIIELRRGVKDLSLGESRYSQVRILVDGTHYLKGMALYSDDMPDGVDVVFNTNKKTGTPMKSVLKEIKNDPDNPFGSAIKDADQGGQYWYDPKTGKRVKSTEPGAKLGLINKRADEGDWSDWKDTLPSQFLAKQNINMAKKQLNLAKADKQAEFDEICALTNPTIKKHMLQKFADSCDAAAVDLKAAALPGQKYHVIIPVNSLKDTEVYAPQYDNGTKLALIRYPHGGTFEIPILTVNNKHGKAAKLLGKDVGDAVGINSKVAERLSGADFDGDTVMCIPTHDSKGKVKITSTPPLKGLEGFDPKVEYGPDTYAGKEVRLMTKKGTQTQMGIISNLITDMTLAGASDAEKAAAVRHSMVVIDAHKHKLNYKQSEIDNNIAALHKKYQGKTTGGAATILSRSKGEKSVDKRKGSPKINEKGKSWYDPNKPEGSLIWSKDPDAFYEVTKVNKRTGEVTTTTKAIKQKTTKMADTDDAYTLLSDARHPMEIVYADYANSMKSLANKARMEMVGTGKIAYSSSAKATYQKEVDSLMSKLNTALLNTTRERAAQRLANAEIISKKKAGQLTDKGDEKKARQRALSKYRTEVGATARKDRNISITDKEWEAIQAGAISESKLKQILDNTDTDKLRERATPRSTTTLSQAKINRIKSYSASNYSLNEISKKLGVSPSTVAKYLKGVN